MLGLCTWKLSPACHKPIYRGWLQMKYKDKTRRAREVGPAGASEPLFFRDLWIRCAVGTLLPPHQ